jgi:small subunit ribosomal protein S10
MTSLRQTCRWALASRALSTQATRPRLQASVYVSYPAPACPRGCDLCRPLILRLHRLKEAPEAAAPSPKTQPRSVQAVYLKPFRREAKYGIPSCDLQLRSYSVRNLEFFADFALRAAYYLGLPAFGPVPLPRITERWTVPKCHFIFKKAQENFERITMRRLIQIRDGNPETVQIWLAFLNKHAYYGIGMKANIWEFSKVSAGKGLDDAALSAELQQAWKRMGQARSLGTEEEIEEQLRTRRFSERD